MSSYNRCHPFFFAVPLALLFGCAISPAASTQSTYPMGEMGGRVKLDAEYPAQLEVTKVASGLPAAKGGLRVGDVITGVAGQPFTDGYLMPVRMLGTALDNALVRNTSLKLSIRRSSETKQLEIPLPSTGGFSSTYPFDCPKSQRIYNQVCANMRSRIGTKGLQGGAVTNSLAVMALIGHQSGGGLQVVEPYVMKSANKYAEGAEGKERSVWLLSYTGVMLCEYYLASPDDTVAAAINNIAIEMAKYIPDHGRYGHGLKTSDVNSVAYNGQGLNATTTAALWFFASAVRCGVEPDDIRPAFDKAVERIRKETNSNGGVGYAWKGDHQSPMRSGHTALAWSHLVSLPQLVGPHSPELLRYRAAVATWPTRHSDHLLEAHAVSSMGITSSTAGLAAFDRQQYQQLMQEWRWYFTLAWQPDPEKPGTYEVAYVGGPNNTGGDFYLNGHRGLESGFNSIMHATVGFIFASSHERLSFYGGMPPIPGLTSAMVQSEPRIRAAVTALRKSRHAEAMKIAQSIVSAPIEEGKKKTEKQITREAKVRTVAQGLVEYLDEHVFAPELARIEEILDRRDLYQSHQALLALEKRVRGLSPYESQVTAMIESIENGPNFAGVAAGKKFYQLEKLFHKSPKRGAKLLEKFLRDHGHTFYGPKAQALLGLEVDGAAPATKKDDTNDSPAAAPGSFQELLNKVREE